MFFGNKEKREKRMQCRKAKMAFRDYARNGWESPWLHRNSLWKAIRK